MRSFKEVVLPDGMLDAAKRMMDLHDRYLYDELEDFLKRVIYFKQLRNIYHHDVSSKDSIGSITKKVRMNPEATYFLNNKGYKSRQETGYARSLSDIYRICKSYHPEVKLHTVMLRMLHATGYNYCSVVRKIVFHRIHKFHSKGYGWRASSMINSETEFSRRIRSRKQYEIIKKLDL